MMQLDGAKFRKWREAHGLGLNETARLVKMSPTFLCDFEYGRRTLGPLTASKLALFMAARSKGNGDARR